MTAIGTFVQTKLNRNPVFKFISSVRMAVPLMLFLATIVAVGTVYESRYNTAVAQVYVYRSYWFLALLILLWINIFCATVSRIPFRKAHTGFVVTHLGLLTLLAGAALTFCYGVDGQLRVVQGQSARTVLLQELSVQASMEPMRGHEGEGEATSWSFAKTFRRTLSEKKGSDLGLEEFQNRTGLWVERYLPMVSIEQSYKSGNASNAVAVRFKMESPFFNVQQVLHTQDQPELRMGPAVLRIVPSSNKDASPARRSKPKKSPSIALPSGAVLSVLSLEGGKEIARIPLQKLMKNPQTVGSVTLHWVRSLEQALVSGGKLTEGGQKGANPALEIRAVSSGKEMREVAFKKYPDFSLNPKGVFGLKFAFLGELPESAISPHEDSGGLPPGHPVVGSAEVGGLDRSANTVEFHVLSNRSDVVSVELYKNNSKILTQTLKAGEVLQTPWMGMKLTLEELTFNAEGHTEIKPLELAPKVPQLPPSAIYVRPLRGSSSEGTWILEGEEKVFQNGQSSIQIYYGPELLSLPFSIQLDQFRKVDYPGTQTAMSFESDVRVNGSGTPITIKMNEPHQQDGFVLYQSSYEMEPGRPIASIFSVNRDPGRPYKYIGAVILVLGIAIFVAMRSRYYRSLATRTG